jgi:hypothetical protein
MEEAESSGTLLPTYQTPSITTQKTVILTNISLITSVHDLWIMALMWLITLDFN